MADTASSILAAQEEDIKKLVREVEKLERISMRLEEQWAAREEREASNMNVIRELRRDVDELRAENRWLREELRTEIKRAPE